MTPLKEVELLWTTATKSCFLRFLLNDPLLFLPCIVSSFYNLLNIYKTSLDFCVYFPIFLQLFHSSLKLAFLAFSCSLFFFWPFTRSPLSPQNVSRKSCFSFYVFLTQNLNSCWCPLLLLHSSQHFPLMVILALEFLLEPVKAFGNGNSVSIHFSLSSIPED